jgi:hydrogenase expression/formation protein HypE
MKGARPLALSLSFIIEEGFPLTDLKRIISSIEDASRKAGVPVVTGDTKVVPKGKGDKIFINTSGIGIISKDMEPGFHRIKPGDSVIVSGTVGDHGVTIMNQREGFGLSGDLKSDSMPLHKLVEVLLRELGEDLHCLRDPTRGGLATILWEISDRIRLEMELNEKAIPVSKAVQGAAEILGLDPLYLANEGKLIAWVSNQAKDKAIKIMKEREEGKKAAIIGEVTDKNSRKIVLNTKAGGKRPLHALTGAPLPRIC